MRRPCNDTNDTNNIIIIMAFVDYDKIVLFGDSITEQSFEQTRYSMSSAHLHYSS